MKYRIHYFEYSPCWIRYLFFLFSLLSTSIVEAQPTDVGIALTGGRVIPVNGSRYEAYTPTLGIAADLYWQQTGTQDWIEFWHQPYFGAHLAFSYLNGDLVGNRLELGALVQAPIGYGFSWNYNVGFSFYTNPYSRSHNEENIFIGSYLNVLLAPGFLYEITLRDGATLSIGGHLVHSSNGYLYKPNRGMNYLQAELGLRLPTNRTREEPLLDSLSNHKPFQPSTHPYLSLAPSLVMSRNDPVDVIKYYFAYSLQAGLITHCHPCFSFGCNADMMYNYAHRLLSHENEKPAYWGVSAFAETHWGGLTLRAGAGHYLDYYWQNWEQWYLRAGIYQSFGGRHRIGVAMKLHQDHIDYVEWTYMIEI